MSSRTSRIREKEWHPGHSLQTNTFYSIAPARTRLARIQITRSNIKRRIWNICWIISASLGLSGAYWGVLEHLGNKFHQLCMGRNDNPGNFIFLWFFIFWITLGSILEALGSQGSTRATQEQPGEKSAVLTQHRRFRVNSVLRHSLSRLIKHLRVSWALLDASWSILGAS